MSDDTADLVLVFLKELPCTGEGYLVDVPVHLIGGHTDTAVGDLKDLFLFVEFDYDLRFADLFFEFAAGGKGLELFSGIHRIGDYLTEENLVVAVKELLDDREYVFRSYSNLSFVHFL